MEMSSSEMQNLIKKGRRRCVSLLAGVAFHVTGLFSHIQSTVPNHQ